MFNKKVAKPLNLTVIEQWLESFFLDPLTSFLDETIFRIDLFETAEEYIVEALLPSNECHVTVKLKDMNVIIKATPKDKRDEPKERIISFPFSVIQHHVRALVEGEILEIYISKETIENGKDRIVPI